MCTIHRPSLSKPSLQRNQSSTRTVGTKSSVNPVIKQAVDLKCCVHHPSTNTVETKSAINSVIDQNGRPQVTFAPTFDQDGQNQFFNEISDPPRLSKPSLPRNHSSTQTVETKSSVKLVIDQDGRPQVKCEQVIDQDSRN